MSDQIPRVFREQARGFHSSTASQELIDRRHPVLHHEEGGFLRLDTDPRDFAIHQSGGVRIAFAQVLRVSNPAAVQQQRATL